jgi:hypothetical protein
MNTITDALAAFLLALAVGIGVFGLSIDWDRHDYMLKIEAN